MTKSIFAEKILEILDAHRADEKRFDESCGNVGPALPDPLADVTVHLGGVDVVYTTDGGRKIHTTKTTAAVSMTFDGAGYDLLSASGEYEAFGGSTLRAKILTLAEENGYRVEDETNWAMGFYRD